MKILLVVFTFCLAGVVVAEKVDIKSDKLAEGAARVFVTQLAKGKYKTAAASFDSRMKQLAPPDKLKQIWQAVSLQAGPYKKQLGCRIMPHKTYKQVFVTCRFERMMLDVKVVFDNKKQIAGLFFVPTKQENKVKIPAHLSPMTAKEQAVVIGDTPWQLPGTLTLPENVKAAPVLILVHGSGPQDRDETIGPNKPFRDIAQGLAKKGIATLRYEKRTKHHIRKLANMQMTVKEETIDDVLAAVKLMQKTAGIDPKRIFVLGHSLGGMLIPRIAARDKSIAGFIMLAANSRPLEDLIYDQYRYIFNSNGDLSEQENKELAKIAIQVKLVKSKALAITTPAETLPLAIPPAYWLDLKAYDQVKKAQAMTRPLLILQGERDYQVTMKDYEKWQKSLKGKKNVSFKSYPALNHLFMAGKGKSMPVEYTQLGFVDKAVIDDIASFIEHQPSRANKPE